jgi:hypothetical protein
MSATAKDHQRIKIFTCIKQEPANGRISDLFLLRPIGLKVKLNQLLHHSHFFILR